jgi:hypothetical protein
MMRLHSLYLSVVLLSLVCSTLVNAQTGPISPNTNPGQGQTVNPPAQSPSLGTPENVAAFLQRLGYTVQTQTMQNGAVTLIVNIRQNDWTFKIEMPFSSDRTYFSLICPLGSPASQLSPAQMLALLKANAQILGYFMYRERDQQLCLENDGYSVHATEASFREALERFLQNVRNTHNVWDASRWQAVAAGPNAAPAPNASR